MSTLMTDVKSTEPIPDEDFLNALRDQENESLKRELADSEAVAERRQTNMVPLLKGSGLGQTDIAKKLKAGADYSRKLLKEDDKQFARPAVDFKRLFSGVGCDERDGSVGLRPFRSSGSTICEYAGCDF